MSEDRQITTLIATGLFFCLLILGYAAFFAEPMQFYIVSGVGAAGQTETNGSTLEAMPEEPVAPIEEPTDAAKDDGLNLISFPVNINTASLLELMQLDGIGEVTAEHIIAYREENGAFSDIQELMQVKGIGEVKFAKIELSITVD